MMKLIAILVLGLTGLFVLVQLVPYGRNHTNPPVLQEYPWPSPEARAVAKRACYDCHSNETTWYWYTNIAPFSWLIQHDVDEGRSIVNFSEWMQGKQEGTSEIGEVIQEGTMPPLQYTLIHPSAKLSAADKDILLRSLPGLESGSNESEGEGGESGEGGEGGN
jgi:hypothetical protein